MMFGWNEDQVVEPCCLFVLILPEIIETAVISLYLEISSPTLKCNSGFCGSVAEIKKL
jgi:hypothetical protein